MEFPSKIFPNTIENFIAEITTDDSHVLVKLTEIIDWSKLTVLAMSIGEANGR